MSSYLQTAIEDAMSFELACADASALSSGALEAPPIEGYRSDATGTACATGPAPGARALLRELGARSPGHGGIFNCRPVRGGTRLSLHAEGRAVDWYRNAADAAEKADAEAIAAWLLAADDQGNEHALARRMGVQEIIWNRRIWTARRHGEGWRAYSGVNAHTDHMHIGLNWPGARMETSHWRTPASTAKSLGDAALSPIREAILKEARAAVGAVEGAADGKFKALVGGPMLEQARKKAGLKGATHTTCNDFQAVIWARGKAALERAKLGTAPKYVTASNAPTLAAWVVAEPGMPATKRPQPGDIYLLSKIERTKRDGGPDVLAKGKYSHIGFIESVENAGTDEEIWTTIDGGQGSKTRYDAAGNLIGGHGAESIGRNRRVYVSAANVITGERMQDADQRLVTGWLDVDALVTATASARGLDVAKPRWAAEPLPGYTCPAPPEPGDAPDSSAPFGGDRVVAAYAAVLVKTWEDNWDAMVAKVDPKRNPGDMERLKAIRARITPAGLDAIYKSIMKTMRAGSIKSRRLAWMRAHRELFEFCFAPPRLHGNWPVVSFKRVGPHARDTTPIGANVRDPQSIKVHAGVAAFLDKLAQRLAGQLPPSNGRIFTAANYSGHFSGPGVADQGLSVDVTLRTDPARGFFHQRDALLFFQALSELAAEETAKAPSTPTKWCALYNDSTVARVVNAKEGRPRIGWMLGWNLANDPGNCHGPDPLKLHIHLELQTADSYAAPPGGG